MKRLLCITLLIFSGCGPHKSSSQNTGETDRLQTSGNAVRSEFRVDSLNTKPTKKLVTGQFNFRKHKDFVKVDPQDADKEVYLQKRTYQAFKAMADSAKNAGIRLIIVSGTRNFTYQKSIWDRKWRKSKAPTDSAKASEILQFSSMPMTSRHHWGTDLDLNNLNNSYFEKGRGKKEYDWLKAHANQFGFYQPYTDKSLHGRTGYNEEKWHWSYLPLAGPYLAYYNAHVTNKDISGFKGAELAPKIDMVGKYVNGISVKIKQYDK